MSPGSRSHLTKDWKQVERYRHGQRPARENLVNPLDLKRTLVTFERASA
jgi:hypothetical protein